MYHKVMDTGQSGTLPVLLRVISKSEFDSEKNKNKLKNKNLGRPCDSVNLVVGVGP